jgi:iron-sulfur cluster assembly accessory protein
LTSPTGARVVIDGVSLDLIKGSQLDYIQELIGSTFKVVAIPNAQSGCGCGSSFNIKIE